MRKIIKLTDAQVSELSKTKQTGMGFHTVSVKLKNGESLTKKTVLNGRFLVIEEEDIIKRIENFSANGANEPIFLPFRKAGSEFWPSLRKADEIKIKTDAIKQQIKKMLNETIDVFCEG